jgi:hypothetical protein
LDERRPDPVHHGLSRRPHQSDDRLDEDVGVVVIEEGRIEGKGFSAVDLTAAKALLLRCSYTR